MQIAYVITAHKLPDQLVRPVKKLKTSETSFYIQVDRKTDEKLYGRMAEQLSSCRFSLVARKAPWNIEPPP